MTEPIIKFHNISKTFEDSGVQVLKNIDFELEEGKFYTLLGASGSREVNYFEYYGRTFRANEWGYLFGW